jgi:hypothetical protein
MHGTSPLSYGLILRFIGHTVRQHEVDIYADVARLPPFSYRRQFVVIPDSLGVHLRIRLGNEFGPYIPVAG